MARAVCRPFGCRIHDTSTGEPRKNRRCGGVAVSCGIVAYREPPRRVTLEPSLDTPLYVRVCSNYAIEEACYSTKNDYYSLSFANPAIVGAIAGENYVRSTNALLILASELRKKGKFLIFGKEERKLCVRLSLPAVTAQGKHHPLQWNIGSVHR